MNDGMRLPFENERSWPVQPLWTVFAPIARLADTSLPVLSVSIHSGISDKELSNEERERNVWLSEDRSKYQKVVPGDLVYNSMRAWQGGFGACQTLGLVSPAYGVLSPISTINTKFYELLFRTKGYIALFDTFSPGIIDFRKRLSWDRCKHMKVPVPPLEEQNRIVKFACNVGAKVHLVTQKLQQQLDLLIEYRQSLITRAVTKGLDGDHQTSFIPLKYLAKLNPDVEQAMSDEIEYLPMEKVKNGMFLHHSDKLANLPPSLNSFEDGDILLAKVTPCFENGNICLAENCKGGVGRCSTELFVLRPNPEKVMPKFLMLLLQTQSFKQEAACQMRGTGGLKRIPADWLCNYKFPIPSLEKQKQIVEYMASKHSNLDGLTKIIKDSICLLNDYRSSLIFAAVTGQFAIDEAAE